MNNICIYCNEPIEEKEFISFKEGCAHSKCFTNYLNTLDELTEFIDLDGGDYHKRNSFYDKRCEDQRGIYYN